MEALASQRNHIRFLLLMEISWQMWKTDKPFIASKKVFSFLKKLLVAKKIPVSKHEINSIIKDSSCFQIDPNGNLLFVNHYFSDYFLAKRLYLTLCKQKETSIQKLLNTRLYNNNILYFLAMLDQKTNRIEVPLQKILQGEYLNNITENALHIYYTTSQLKNSFPKNSTMEHLNNGKNITQFNVTQHLDFSLEVKNNTIHTKGTSTYTDKSRADHFFQQGLELLKEKRYFEAMAPFFTAKSLDPDCFKAYNNLSIIFKNLGSFSIAKQIVQNVLLEDPNNARAKDHLRILETIDKQRKQLEYQKG